jgi:methylmalonyl-CoA mutase C-terminal domain/subunit
MIAEAALHEDVDVVGLSVLSGAHMALVPRVLELLRGQGQEHVRVLVGGIIPDEDAPSLKALGVADIFGPGTNTLAVAEAVKKAVAAGRAEA